jgi:competence protein ComEA
MIKKVIAAFALAMAVGSVFAAVDVNTANTDALRGIKGIGPAKAKAILDERDAHGPFKDAAELGKRVKGMGGKTVERLQAEGLTVGPASKTAAAHPGSAAFTAAAAGQPVVVKK